MKLLWSGTGSVFTRTGVTGVPGLRGTDRMQDLSRTCDLSAAGDHGGLGRGYATDRAADRLRDRHGGVGWVFYAVLAGTRNDHPLVVSITIGGAALAMTVALGLPSRCVRGPA